MVVDYKGLGRQEFRFTLVKSQQNSSTNFGISGIQKERGHLQDLEVNGKIFLKRTLLKWGRTWLILLASGFEELPDSGIEELPDSGIEELPDSIKDGRFLDYLSVLSFSFSRAILCFMELWINTREVAIPVVNITLLHAGNWQVCLPSRVATTTKNFMFSLNRVYRAPVNRNQVPADRGAAPAKVTAAITGLRKALCPLRWRLRKVLFMETVPGMRTLQNGYGTKFRMHKSAFIISIKI